MFLVFLFYFETLDLNDAQGNLIEETVDSQLLMRDICVGYIFGDVLTCEAK